MKAASTLPDKIVRKVKWKLRPLLPYWKAQIPPEFKIYIDSTDPRGLSIYDSQNFAPGTGDVIVKLWRSSEVFKPTYYLDVGSNYGEVSFSTSYGPQVKQVFLIEANPRIVRAIKKSISIQPQKEKFSVIHRAVWNQSDQTIALSVPVTSSGIGSIMNMQGLHPEIVTREYSVSTLTLDDLLKDKAGETLVMKLDIEGAELEVLQGATNIFEKNKVVCFVELSSLHFHHLEVDPDTYMDRIRTIGNLYFYNYPENRLESLEGKNCLQIYEIMKKLGDVDRKNGVDYFVHDFILFSKSITPEEIARFNETISTR